MGVYCLEKLRNKIVIFYIFGLCRSMLVPYRCVVNYEHCRSKIPDIILVYFRYLSSAEERDD